MTCEREERVYGVSEIGDGGGGEGGGAYLSAALLGSLGEGLEVGND